MICLSVMTATALTKQSEDRPSVLRKNWNCYSIIVAFSLASQSSALTTMISMFQIPIPHFLRNDGKTPARLKGLYSMFICSHWRRSCNFSENLSKCSSLVK